MATIEARAIVTGHRRVVVKVGTSVVSHTNGVLALGRLGHIVEDIARLVWSGKQVLLVSSGSVGVGRTKLLHQSRMSASFRQHIHGNVNETRSSAQACAAAGQSGLMGFYDLLFGHHDISCAQVLVTSDDFADEKRAAQMRSTLNSLLEMKVVPIVNENDVLAMHEVGSRREGASFWDNDSLASLLAQQLQADMLVLLTDVKGVYKSRPERSEREDQDHSLMPDPIPHLTEEDSLDLTGKSAAGRGGMFWKVHAARRALAGGVRHVIIASGYTPSALLRAASGQVEGTLLGPVPPASPAPSAEEDQAMAVARMARAASRQLPALPRSQRVEALRGIAEALRTSKRGILEANQADQSLALEKGMEKDSPLFQRLVMTEAKLETLARGIEQIADQPDPAGRVLRRTRVAAGIRLAQITAPVGVVLVIFESRPDVLPQIASLALSAGCGLVLKGGSEALRSNMVLLELVNAEIARATGVPGAVQLLRQREDVMHLLQVENSVDLVIPRGSRKLVEATKAMTNVPVLGHADGVCHLFMDEHCNQAEAIRIALDAKTDYPAACNATETILVHQALLELPAAAGVGPDTGAGTFFAALLHALTEAGVECHAGPVLASTPAGSELPACEHLSHEYGSLGVTLEVVPDVRAAAEHINEFGSHHTDSILTSDAEAARYFRDNVDSACVFHNASTRFADGFRLGLGAEVGISTGRIHARGPVGVEGLLSTKWVLEAADGAGVVGDYKAGTLHYTHEPLPETEDYP